ncbi:MAG: hypothetical protein AAGF92_00915 [Myxococcota bacterium]
MRKLVILALCFVLACSKQNSSQEATAEPEANTPTDDASAAPAAPSEPPATATVEEPEPEPAVVPRPEVELLSKGSAPRHPLRWDFKAGMEGSATIEMKMNAAVTIDENSQPPTPTPPILTTMDVVVQEVDDTGTALIGFTVSKVGVGEDDEVPASVSTQIETSLANIVGLRGSYRCEAGGFVSEVSTEVPPQASAAVRQAVENIRQSLRQMSVPFPDEPVGKGARWKLVSQYPYSGMQVTEAATFTIKKIRMPNVVASVSVTQTAPPQTITGGNGQSGELEALKTDSKGVNRWNFEEVLPAEVTRDSSMSMTMKGPGNDGADHRVTLDVDFTVQMKSE